MRKQHTPARVPAFWLRSAILMAVIRGFRWMAGQRKDQGLRKRMARMDMDQRVRETGEW